MSGGYILAIDAGTSTVRCAIFDEKGRLKAISRREWDYDTAPDADLLGRIFVPDQLWRIVCEVSREALYNAGIKASEIAGVSATSQREGMVLVDGAGKELYAGPNIDLRASMERILIDNDYAQEIHSITGHLPSLLFAPAKLRWFKKYRSELYDRIATVLTISDWIIYKISGELASEVWLRDGVRQCRWSPRNRYWILK